VEASIKKKPKPKKKTKKEQKQATERWAKSLTQGEEDALDHWQTGEGYTAIRKALSPDFKGKVTRFTLKFKGAVDKAPNLEGTVFRAGQIDREIAKKIKGMKEGSTFEFGTVSSASTKEEATFVFLDHHPGTVASPKDPFIFEIKGKTTADTRGFFMKNADPDMAAESEVLLRAGAKYRVEGFDFDLWETGTTKVFLVEI